MTHPHAYVVIAVLLVYPASVFFLALHYAGVW